MVNKKHCLKCPVALYTLIDREDRILLFTCIDCKKTWAVDSRSPFFYKKFPVRFCMCGRVHFRKCPSCLGTKFGGSTCAE